MVKPAPPLENVPWWGKNIFKGGHGLLGHGGANIFSRGANIY